MKMLKKFLLMMCFVFALGSQLHADNGQRSSLLIGAVVGAGAEKLLYHAPIMLSFPSVAVLSVLQICLIGAVSPDSGDDKNQRNAFLAALATAGICYWLESETPVVEKKEHTHDRCGCPHKHETKHHKHK